MLGINFLYGAQSFVLHDLHNLLSGIVLKCNPLSTSQRGSQFFLYKSTSKIVKSRKSYSNQQSFPVEIELLISRDGIRKDSTQSR